MQLSTLGASLPLSVSFSLPEIKTNDEKLAGLVTKDLSSVPVVPVDPSSVHSSCSDSNRDDLNLEFSSSDDDFDNSQDFDS